MSIGIWQIVGIALVVWVLYDLFAGYTYSYRLVMREAEPWHFWITVLLWSAIAAVTLLAG